MAKRERAVPIIQDDGFTINGCTFHVDTKYTPLDAIGQGSYGVVCSVLNTDSNEKLAIKKITPMAGDEWDATHTLREIRLMRCLGAHENIISLKDLSMCQEKDELYMMMELADTDLHRLIQSSCPLTEGHIRVIMFQVLSGVKAMHDNGVLHRDLKPGNLLLNKECELKITDFGLARMMPKDHQSVESGPNASTVVSPMTEYVVTRWYRPPELMLAPNGCYDGAVDMWSVGCILGELIARKPMFPGTDFMDQLTRVFRMIPIPEKEHRGYNIEKDALKFLSSLPPTQVNAMENLCRGGGRHAFDLMKRLLCFNPKERISADEALAHPFFDGVKEEWGEIASLKLDHSLEFAFENQSLPLSTLRQYICDEVRAFRQHDDALRSKRKDQLQQQRAATAAAAKEATPEEEGANTDNIKPANIQITTKEPAVKEPPLTLENDCLPGKGFTLKGCEFNVPVQYKPLQVLGEGSYGIVCAASDTITKKNVAVKKITPMAGDEWDAKHTLREIRLMRYFGRHPNIASLQNLSTCAEKDELYIMMDLVDTDLHRLIQSKTKLEEAHIAAIMYQVLCGAMTLHENGVLHRDLKPGNLLVSKNCDVKITDFGLSRYIPHGGARTQANDPKADKAKELMTEYVVTRWYRPPEIMLAPNGTYNEAVDMWSIGCIFGELLNRRPLFPGTDFIDQLTRVFSVLPVPSSDKRGYVVEGDALKFLESLPPCSPSAITKTFRKASPEAVSLLRRLLCINPERRITAKQALAHPYFKSIRQQLGEPPEFQVGKTFDFEFDYEDFPLSHLKKLIQEEVKLLQQDQKDPEVNQAVRYGDTKVPSDQQETAANQDPVAKHANESAKKMEKSPAQSDDLSENDDDFLDSQSDAAATHPMPEKPKPAEFLTKPAPKTVISTASATNAAKQTTAGVVTTDTTAPRSKEREPETDEVDSDSESTRHRQHKPPQQQHQPANDSEDDEQQEVIQVERSKRPASGKLERPKSAGTTRRSTLSYRDARDEDEHHRSSLHTRSSSSSSSSNNNNDVRASSNEKNSSDSRWGQPCVLQSSRLQQPVHSSTSHLSDRRPQKAIISARTATSSSSSTVHSSRSSNQAKDSGDKSDSTRHAERVSLSSSRTSSSSSSRTATISRSSPSSSTSSSESLPDGWVKKIHSKSGKEYYYDTNTKVSSWKHPAKLLENIFGTTCIPQTAQKHAHTSSSESLTPTSSTSISSSSSSSLASSRRTIATTRGTASSKQPALPKDWARRIDPKTGRLFYLNLVTNKSFTKLPASVLASMAAANASSKETTPTAGSSATARRTSEQQPLKKKVTVPQSPQFSQMSWQRKKAHTADD